MDVLKIDKTILCGFSKDGYNGLYILDITDGVYTKFIKFMKTE